MSDYSVIPPTGEYGNDWPDNHVLPQGKGGSISQAGWTEEAQGFPQQTFLGASIRTFNISAGFGDTSSQLSVDLVNDEYNKSDGLPIGQGDDVYHNGLIDTFQPPVVGTPVYFKFGKNFATVDQAYRAKLDSTYGYNTVPSVIDFPTVTTTGDITKIPGDNYFLRDTTGTDASAVHTWVNKSSLLDATNNSRGKDHFVFGGILQSYTQSKGSNGSPLYSLNVTDPREILSNATVILNNYQNTTFNNKNLFNAYGFLEYDVSDELKEEIEGTDVLPNPDLKSKNILTKNVDVSGIITYTGDDTYSFNSLPFAINNFPPSFPITGQGFSRRGDQGIPWYRVNQALTALFGFNGALPDEYVNAGFGGSIDFRGYKYVVDFTGIPIEKIPQMYFMDFDQLTLMDLAQELADVISHDLFVSLLPVIDHPAYSWLYNLNQYNINNGNTTDVIAGVIRIDAIDRSVQPDYGSIKSYIDGLAANGVEVENQDIGFELSNVTTDKFVVGANEVDMFYFTNHRDRNNLQLRRKNNGLPNDFEYLEERQWDMETSLKQQIIPFYGFLGKDAVTIPRGFGAYQQILLDTSSLNAVGVGNYYVATELELRIALKGYSSWSKFLADYNDLYIQDVSEDQAFYKGMVNTEIINLSDDDIDAIVAKYTEDNRHELEALRDGDYAVSVPRCVFNSDKDFMGHDGYPASPSSPPYGYPLYYKRAEKIGISEVGTLNFTNAFERLVTDFESYRTILSSRLENDDVELPPDIVEMTQGLINGQLDEIDLNTLSVESQVLIVAATSDAYGEAGERGAILKDLKTGVTIFNAIRDNRRFYRSARSTGGMGEENAKKIHAFLKKIAEENLGKKFLVKIPKACNLTYDKEFKLDTKKVEMERGPFGFKPQPINSDAGYGSSFEFNIEISGILIQNQVANVNQGTSQVSRRELFNHYLNVDAKDEYSYGALKNNFNPISEKWEFNYEPASDGGFFNFALYDKNLSFTESQFLDGDELPLSTKYALAPRDLSTIVSNNGRMSCYLRYDHSQFLDMSLIPKDKLTQQVRTSNGFIEDILEELDNTNPDYKTSFERIRHLDQTDLPEIVSYVTCDVDSNLYLTPKIHTSGVTIYGRNIQWLFNEQAVDFVTQTDSDGCLGLKPIVSDFQKVFAPADNGGAEFKGHPFELANNTEFKRVYNSELDAYLVDTEKQNLDPDHVYALVTVPGIIKPLIDTRYRDADFLKVNPQVIKHNLTEDVVRGPIGFEKPSPIINDRDISVPCPTIATIPCADGQEENSVGNLCSEDCDCKPGLYCKPTPNDPHVVAPFIGRCAEGTRAKPQAGGAGATQWLDTEFNQFTRAMKEQRLAVSNSIRGSKDYNISMSQPSPVYPDLVAMPLLSNERCYGPWMSASIIDSNASVRYSNIGGKVEFVKDENLAPWNFAGYQLMNEAGSLQAQFSNSLLLFGEKGSFSMPEAPTGLSIAEALKTGGPLVTSINVSVDESSIRTSVNMDLYTSRFGKLQKQKEELISKIARERQKIIDQNNTMIRQGLGKSATNIDLLAPLRQQGEALEDLAKFSSDQSKKTQIKYVLDRDAKTGKVRVTTTMTDDKAEKEKDADETPIQGYANQYTAPTIPLEEVITPASPVNDGMTDQPPENDKENVVNEESEYDPNNDLNKFFDETMLPPLPMYRRQ